MDERIGLPSFAADVDGPSDGGSARGLEDRGPARVEARIPQQLGGRSGSIGQADFDREIVRPGMIDLHRDPGPLDKAFHGRRMDVDCGRPGGRNRGGHGAGGDRHRVHSRLLVQVAESVPVRVARTGVEHEVIEVHRVGGARQSGGAVEADRDPDEFRVRPMSGGEVHRGIPREVRPDAKAARRRQDHVRLRRPAKRELPARLERGDVSDAIEAAVVLVQQIERDARGIRIPWRDAGILEMIIEQGHAQFRDGGSPGRVDRVPVRGPEIQDRISRDVHMIRPHPRPNVRGRIPGRRLVPEKEIRVWQPEVGLEVVDQRRRTRRRTGQNRQDT